VSGIVVDNFAGGGGASTGIEAALGRHIDYAVNHDPEAIAMHRANHPRTHHFCGSVWDYAPKEITRGRNVELGWFSPDCTFHSKARGGKPFRDRNTARRRRGLAWLVTRWAKEVRPEWIMLENVEEFADWGPLLDDGTIDPKRRGTTFRRWHRQLENLGYQVDMRELRACDYGAPTTRKRLFVIATRTGSEIIFPEASHGPGRAPYRTAAECIDWSIPCPSIFERNRPLAEATLRRIARGVMRYVVNNPRPFIVPMTHSGERAPHSIDEPLRTITTASRGELAVCTPFIAGLAHGDHKERAGGRGRAIDQPVGTIHAGGGNFALVAPALINTRNGERAGQAPRVRDIRDPFPTVTAAGSQGAVVAAFLAQHNGGFYDEKGCAGRDARQPLSTITVRGTQQNVVTSHIVKLRGDNIGHGADEPLHTLSAQGQHFGEVRAFLLKYYGTDQNPGIARPLDTVTTKDRFGLVTVHGAEYAIVDIGMRMLTPRELFRAQSFPDGYVIDPEVDGAPLTKTAQVRMCGNSVPPVMSEALVRANVVDQRKERAA
jgi:DNA (cytosine-5)-methyltransferase 1